MSGCFFYLILLIVDNCIFRFLIDIFSSSLIESCINQRYLLKNGVSYYLMLTRDLHCANIVPSAAVMSHLKQLFYIFTIQYRRQTIIIHKIDYSEFCLYYSKMSK